MTDDTELQLFALKYFLLALLFMFLIDKLNGTHILYDALHMLG